jgi:hypothetical protein
MPTSLENLPRELRQQIFTYEQRTTKNKHLTQALQTVTSMYHALFVE